ncbi:MAG: NADPH-dependent 7-cyano-7-deazaguanine reductase QueF [Azoarcus sp.]|nr:NADPH-dependent 7-cyano-7-deazaguanine reductase QueF [Azoarcus sp.]
MKPIKPSGAAASPLGRAVAYRDTYAPDLLFPIERALKRAELGFAAGAPLPFVGEDLWNAYEVSWLNRRGKPVVALGRFTVPAASPRLIESKSLKLYLNSLNQTSFDDCEVVRATIATDLSAAAGASVEVVLEPLSDFPRRRFAEADGALIDVLDVAIDAYAPQPEVLSADFAAPSVEETLYSHLLKSNCLVTGQPDWGTVCVRYRGPRIERENLLRYVVSFRTHDEFHEQCVERMFRDILAACRPERLAVWARYTRRGGLDINPFRATPGEAPPDNRFDVRQ